MQIPDLIMTRCDDEGNPTGEKKKLPCVGYFNDRPYWRISYHHYFLYSKGCQGYPVPECWCLANLKGDEDCFHVLDRPVAPQTSGMFPPEGAWIRGRPWMNDTCFPHGRVQFYISKA